MYLFVLCLAACYRNIIGHRQHMKKINGMTGEILTVKEVAEYLKVNGRNVYRPVAAKKIPAFKVGNAWRFQENSSLPVDIGSIIPR